MFRRTPDGLEVFLVHPGGPFFTHKDDGAWSIPKGELSEGEGALAAAIREFEEETGMRPAADTYLALGEIRQAGGKRVEAFAFEGEWGDRPLCSNTFELEWPPHSGRMRPYPEVDRANFFPVGLARRKLNPAQGALLDRLQALV